jgi:hypothetical protein
MSAYIASVKLRSIEFATHFKKNWNGLNMANETLNQLDDWQGVLLNCMAVLAGHFRLIVGVTLLAGAAAYGVAYWLPKVYTSVAYLGPLDEPTAKAAEANIQSGPVLDPVIAIFPQYRSGNSLEERRAGLNSSLRWQIVKGSPTNSAIYTLNFDDTDPHRAQALLGAVVDGWLESIRPRPDRAAKLEKILGASEAQAADLSQVIAELKKRPDAMFADARNGYFPPNIVDMIKMRTEIVTRVVDLTMELRAGSRDTIFGPPTLPERPSSPNKIRIVLASMLAAFGGLIVFLLLRWRLTIVARETVYAPAIAQIRRAIHWSPTVVGKR